MRRVCRRSCPKLLGAFTIVEPYNTLALLPNLGRMRLLHNRESTHFWRVTITEWKIFAIMMRLPILNTIVLSFVVRLPSTSSFPFLSLASMWQGVIDCPFPCNARVFVAFIDALRASYRLTIHSVQYVISDIRLCRRCVLVVAF